MVDFYAPLIVRRTVRVRTLLIGPSSFDPQCFCSGSKLDGPSNSVRTCILGNYGHVRILHGAMVYIGL